LLEVVFIAGYREAFVAGWDTGRIGGYKKFAKKVTKVLT
jgi:hypothetical protein